MSAPFNQKVRVCEEYGDTSVQGLMDPAAGMVTNFGTISVIDATTGVVTMDGTSPAQPRFYPHQLLVTVADAGSFGWPDSGGSVVFGHLAEVTSDYTPGADSSTGMYCIGPGEDPRLVTPRGLT